VEPTWWVWWVSAVWAVVGGMWWVKGLGGLVYHGRRGMTNGRLDRAWVEVGWSGVMLAAGCAAVCGAAWLIWRRRVVWRVVRGDQARWGAAAVVLGVVMGWWTGWMW
jgi:hypothetical protein